MPSSGAPIQEKLGKISTEEARIFLILIRVCLTLQAQEVPDYSELNTDCLSILNKDKQLHRGSRGGTLRLEVQSQLCISGLLGELTATLHENDQDFSSINSREVAYCRGH